MVHWPPILTLQIVHPSGLIDLQPSLFSAPPTERLLGDVDLPARLKRRRARANQHTQIWQPRDELFRRKSPTPPDWICNGFVLVTYLVMPSWL